MLASCSFSVNRNFARVVKKSVLIEKDFKFQDEAKINAILAKYPKDQPRSAILPLLHLALAEQGYLTSGVLKEVARITKAPLGRVHETASFYSMFRFAPPNTHIVEVCRGLSCYICGSDNVKAAIEKACGGSFKEGKSKDGLFTLEEVECLGACANAPVMIVDGVYYQNLTAKKAKEIIKGIKKGKNVQKLDAIHTPPPKP